MLRKLRLRQKHGFVINKRVVQFQLQTHFEFHVAPKTFYWRQSKRDQQKCYFIINMFAFLIHFLVKNF